MPVRNLERVVALSNSREPLILEERDRLYGNAADRPAFLAPTIAEQFLLTVEKLVHEGLLLTYHLKRHIGSYPSGRINPFETEWRTALASRPVAISQRFERGMEDVANGIILAALQRVRGTLRSAPAEMPLSRYAQPRLAKCEAAFEGADGRLAMSWMPRIDAVQASLPQSKTHYRRALSFAALILSNGGLSLRDREGKIELSSILIDMEKIFEAYIRRILLESFPPDSPLRVLDGNKGEPAGAKRSLFETPPAGERNPDATPDIVIRRSNDVELVIDAKYKPLEGLPDRSDRNQVITYAACYNSPKVALLYPQRKPGTPFVSLVGRIGRYELFTFQIDLGSADIEKEERSFTAAVLQLLS